MRGLIAITGGTGFIGRRVLARLLDRGWRVRALVRRPDLSLAAAGAEVVHGSLEDPASLEALVDSAQAVVHCAGAISARNKNEFVPVNRQGADPVGALSSRPATSMSR